MRDGCPQRYFNGHFVLLPGRLPSSRFAATSVSNPDTNASEALRRPWAVGLLAVLIAALGVLPAALGRVQPDTGWYLYSAGRVLDGARMYVDLVEVNPPLIVWLDIVPVALGRAFGVPAELVFTVLVAILAVASVACIGVLLRQIFPSSAGIRRLLGLAAIFVLLPLPRLDFAQREHLLLALTMPYVLLTAIRATKGSAGRPAAGARGAAAGRGIALNPHIVLLWLGLEIGLWWAGSRRWPRLRPESVAVVIVGAIYLGSVVLWTPQYFDVVRLMAAPYFGFLRNSLLVTALAGDGALPPLAALLTAVAMRGSARTKPVWIVVGCAVAGVWLAAVLQQKGWQYHFYPAVGLSLWLLVLILVDANTPLQSPLERLFRAGAVLLVGGMGAVVVAGSVARMVQPRDPRYDEDQDLHRLIPVVREYGRGGSMALFSWSIASTFPLTNYADVRLAFRFPSLWPLAVIYWPDVHRGAPVRYHARAEMGALERFVEDAVVRDFVSSRPDVAVVLWSGRDDSALRLRRLDYLCYFLRDPRFRLAFEPYHYVRTVGEYWIFGRDDPAGEPQDKSPSPVSCPRGAPW